MARRTAIQANLTPTGHAKLGFLAAGAGLSRSAWLERAIMEAWRQVFADAHPDDLQGFTPNSGARIRTAGGQSRRVSA